MDHWARRGNSQIRGRDWRSHAYIPIKEADKKVGSELENAIHSMFSFNLDELPHGTITKARWGKLTLDDYALLRPALRLATQFLESAPSSDAICSIAYGERHPSPEKILHRGFPVAEFHRHDFSPSDMRETAGEVLKRLGKSIRFKVAAIKQGPKESVANGHTTFATRGFPQGVAVTDRQQGNGIASMSSIDSKYLTTLKGLLVGTVGKRFQILKLYFEIALTLCHEVIHATNLALSPDLLNQFLQRGENRKPSGVLEPFYQGQTVAELGYFWENHVFGGACTQSVPVPADPIYLGQWPSWIFRDKKEQPEKVLPKRRALRWLVSAYYIKNIQTQEFWNQINLQYPHDLLALRIRKRVAVKAFIPRGLMEYDTTRDPENKLGGSYRVSFRDDDPSPGARLANETRDEKREKRGRERLDRKRLDREKLDRDRQLFSPGPDVRLANETHDENQERLDREKLDRDRQLLSPGPDPDYLNRVDPLLGGSR